MRRARYHEDTKGTKFTKQVWYKKAFVLFVTS